MPKKKKRKIPVKARNRSLSTVSYVCNNCGVHEEIPEDVLEYFDNVNPMQMLIGSHEFTCEKCDNGIMKPENEIQTIVRGYGVFEGLEFN